MTGSGGPVRPTYLLDTGIVLGFQKCGHLEVLAQAAKRLPLAIVEEVYDEVTEPRNSRHETAAREARKVLDASEMRVCDIPIGSPAATTHSTIRAGKTSSTADLGESASIAFAVHDPSFVFVTNDGAASLRALQELRGRTCSFHPFLALLVEEGAVLLRVAEEIAGAVQRLTDWRAVQPVWWKDWVMRQYAAP